MQEAILASGCIDVFVCDMNCSMPIDPIYAEKYKFKRFSVRSRRFRLTGAKQLYDMEADPGQKVNVIGRYPKVAEKMLEAYGRWWEQTRPLMVNEKEPVFEGKQPYVINYEKQLNSKGIPDWNEPRI